MIPSHSIVNAARMPSSSRERLLVVLVALGLALVGSGWCFVRPEALRFSPQIFAAYGTALVLCELFAAILLLWRAVLIGDAASARITAAFAYAVPLVAAYVSAYPGIWPDGPRAPRDAASWAWSAWQIGWLLGVGWYALGRGPQRGHAVRTALVAVAVSAAAILTTFSGRLPALYAAHGAARPDFWVLHGLTIALGATVVVMLLRANPMTSLHTWLALATGTALASQILFLLHQIQLPGAAGAGRILLLASNAAIVCALVSEFARLLARSTVLDRFMTMAEYASTVVYVLDPSGACTYINRRWSELTGQSLEQAFDQGLTRAIHPDDLTGGLPRYASNIARGQPYELELRYRMRDGNYRWHLTSATPILDQEGRIDGWYGTAVDVDAQHHALEDALRLREEARAREQDVRRIAETIPLMAWTADASGGRDWYNRRWYDFTGQTPAQAAGRGWQAAHHPDDLPGVMQRWDDSLRGGTEFEMELRLRAADGRYRWFLTRATPIADANGRVIKWYGTNTDIDERRREAQLLEALYAREHRIAQTLQAAFFPPFLPQVDGLEFQAVYWPALRDAELGGDWYDAFVLRDGRIALSIGDVVGHGLEAASAMVRLRETLRAVAGLVDNDPALILQTADRSFRSSHPEALATALFGIYDPSARCLTFACAGHPPPALVRGPEVTFLQPGGVPLGVPWTGPFASETVALQPGDVLVLFTDGLLEFDHDVVAGQEHFAAMLAEHADDAERLVSETLGGRQSDDVALLMLAVTGAAARPSWHFKSDDAASAAEARSAFTAHLRRRGVAAETVTTAELVFGELVGNVVRHAPGPIEIELVWRDHAALLAVRDRGRPFEARSIALPSDALSEHGRGLYLVSRFAGAPVILRRPGGGNEVVVEVVPPEGAEPDAAGGSRHAVSA